MNQPYTSVNHPFASALCEVFVQVYKNDARALLLHSLSIVNSDWLQHARSIWGVYEHILIPRDK